MPNSFSHVRNSSTSDIVWQVDDQGNTIQNGTATIKGGVIGPSGQPITQLDWQNVQAYGATGNGSTDDTLALQAAINAANANGGGVVYVPRGTYKISSALTVYSGVTLLGDGVTVSVISQSSTTANGITGSNLTFFSMQDLTVAGPTTGSGVGVNLTGTVVIYQFYVNLTRVLVRNFGGTGIYLNDPVTSVLTNVTSHNNGGEGFHILCTDVSTVGTSTALIDCYAHDNASGNGYRLNNVVYSGFTNCASDKNVNGYKLEVCETVTLTGCGAEANTGDSIQVAGGNNISIWGAWLSESTTNGVHVTSSATNVIVKGVKEFSSTHTPTFIKVDSGCQGVTIENCYSNSSPPRTNSLAAGTTTTLSDTSSNMSVAGTLSVATVGKGLAVAEGTNAKMGTLVLTGATPVVVSTTAVTASSRIFLTTNVVGGTPAFCWVSARTAGTSFSVTGTAGDTSTVAWLIVEPA